jgi:hypothetical protein
MEHGGLVDQKGTVELLRSLRVLQKVDPRQIPTQQGAVIVACPDGDRFPELFDYHRTLCEGGRPCFHPPLPAGGAIVIPETSPAARDQWRDKELLVAEMCLRQIEIGLQFKNTGTVHLYTHWPCAMALSHQLDVLDVIALHIKAKERVRATFEGVTVRGYFHFQVPDGFKTYFLSRQDFLKIGYEGIKLRLANSPLDIAS